MRQNQVLGEIMESLGDTKRLRSIAIGLGLLIAVLCASLAPIQTETAEAGFGLCGGFDHPHNGGTLWHGVQVRVGEFEVWWYADAYTQGIYGTQFCGFY